MSRLAIAITIPETTENSRRSPRSVGISRLPYTSPVHAHLAIPKVWPSFDARLTKRHELFHGSRRSDRMSLRQFIPAVIVGLLLAALLLWLTLGWLLDAITLPVG